MKLEINDEKVTAKAIYRAKNANSHTIELTLDFEQLWLKDTEDEIATAFLESVDHETQCPECNGDGELWEPIDCGKSASYCCGGCGKNVTCEECNSYGTVTLEDSVDFE